MAEQANPNHGQKVRRTSRSTVVKKFGGITAEASSATKAMEQIEASVRRLVDLQERIGNGVILVQSAKHIGLAVPDDRGYTMAVIAKSASSVDTFAATTLTGDDKEGAEMSLRYQLAQRDVDDPAFFEGMEHPLLQGFPSMQEDFRLWLRWQKAHHAARMSNPGQPSEFYRRAADEAASSKEVAA